MKKKYTIKNMMMASLWVALGGVCVFLLVAAIKSKEASRCKGIEINIHGTSNNFFVDKNDILDALKISEKTNPVGKAIGSFNLKKLEQQLEKDIWIKSAELFFDNNEILRVSVYEREPVARVFTVMGTSFYIDEELAMLPLSDKFSARLPVFTSFPSDKKILTRKDSSLLQDIKTISLAIQKDSFSMAMIDQVDINENGMFEMIPKIGNQFIVFGDAKNVEAKLYKIKLFYKEVMVKAGWNNYSVIDISYNNQVVARRKGAADVTTDSLRALQLMKLIAERAEKAAEDSTHNLMPDNSRNTTDTTMIQQSIQRDDNDTETTDETELPQVITSKPVLPKQTVKKTIVKKENKPIVKPEQKKLPIKNESRQPKAVMQKKNDYAPVP